MEQAWHREDRMERVGRADCVHIMSATHRVRRDRVVIVGRRGQSGRRPSGPLARYPAPDLIFEIFSFQ